MLLDIRISLLHTMQLALLMLFRKEDDEDE
jgi:hypothetical protein